MSRKTKKKETQEKKEQENRASEAAAAAFSLYLQRKALAFKGQTTASMNPWEKVEFGKLSSHFGAKSSLIASPYSWNKVNRRPPHGI